MYFSLSWDTIYIHTNRPLHSFDSINYQTTTAGDPGSNGLDGEDGAQGPPGEPGDKGVVGAEVCHFSFFFLIPISLIAKFHYLLSL